MEDMAQNRSGWHVKIKAGPLLRGDGAYYTRRWGDDVYRWILPSF